MSDAQTDLRLGRIVRLLADHAMVVVSGTKLADEIGTSRSEVWRLIQQLRGLGVQVAGHQATGYQLEKVPDLLLPEFVNAALKGTIFADQVRHYFRIGSTNVAAMEAATAGAPGLDLPAVLPDEATYTHRIIKAELAKHAVAPRVRLATNYLETLKMLVGIGLGWSVLPRSMLDRSVRALTIPGFAPSRSLGAVWHARRVLSAPARRLLEHLGPRGRAPR